MRETSLTRSMGFTCAAAVVVAAVFMMLICHTESQAIDTSDVSNCGFLSLLTGEGPCKCVPINLCCETQPSPACADPEDITSCVDERIKVDAVARQDSACPDLLNVCCCKECPKKLQTVSPPTPTPATPTPGHNPGPTPATQPTETETPHSNTNQCGIRNTNGVRITVTGFQDNQAQFGEFPWMVAVLKYGTHEYVGGASLLHKRVVLTAAHKVHELTQSGSMVARIGDWNLDDAATTELIPPQEINVEKVLIHPNFNRKKYENNVALLILEKDAILGQSVMPICLPLSGQVFDGVECAVTGWGKDVFGDAGQYQKIMKKVSVPAINHDECQSMLRNTRLPPNYILHNTLNCAGGRGEDACEGDGGSPLVCPNPNNPTEYVQMGVVAFGLGCGVVGNPGVYGSIPQTVDWIRQTILDEIGLDAFVNQRIIG